MVKATPCTRVVVRILNRRKNTCNRRQALEAACGFGSCASSFQDSSAGNFLGIAGDFFRLPAFIYNPVYPSTIEFLFHRQHVWFARSRILSKPVMFIMSRSRIFSMFCFNLTDNVFYFKSELYFGLFWTLFNTRSTGS